MNVSGIDYESVNDGEGVRTVIYISGCSHNCRNCHNPQTHNINYGIPFTDELENEIFINIKKRPFISGITFSGGDPLHENNLDGVLNLINQVRILFPDKSIWLYTGYSVDMYELYESDHTEIVVKPRSNNIENDLKRANIISKCDVVVDGCFEEDKKNLTLRFRGSSNQRIIDIQKSLEKGDVVLWDTF